MRFTNEKLGLKSELALMPNGENTHFVARNYKPIQSDIS